MKIVLVVDDDPSVAGLVSAILAQGGYQVESAGNAEEAFARLEKHPAQLILLDAMLPGIDGFEALKLLKTSGATAQVPVVMVSTLTEKSYRRKAESLGAAAFVEKPFSPQALLAAVAGAVR